MVKKSQTIKNNFITTESQLLLDVSPTHQGTMNDKIISDEAMVKFSDHIHLFQDSGFQGFCPSNVHLVQLSNHFQKMA